MMTKWLLALAAISLLFSAGCVLADQIIGVEEQPDGTVAPTGKPSPLDVVASFVPSLAGLAALIRWGYTEVRSRRLDGTAKAIVVGITNAVDGGELTKETLYKLISDASYLYANRSFFMDFVVKLKEQVRQARG